jgi:ABC-type dipeptide/oligopeptide/nickel transport system ATPase component
MDTSTDKTKEEVNTSINLIGVVGKSGSGKDLVGKLILREVILSKLQSTDLDALDEKTITMLIEANMFSNNWQIIKFAAPLKAIVAMMTNTDLRNLEEESFKNTEVPEEYRGEWNKNEKPTFRRLLQYLGTDVFKKVFNDRIWANNVFYWFDRYNKEKNTINWVLTDTRFLTEAEEITKRKGILVKVVRDTSSSTSAGNTHASETEMDKISVNHTFQNNGTIEDLQKQVKEFCINQGII